MASIALNRLYKRYGKTEALKDVSLTFETGELTVVMGHSGAGKTSMLRVIAGLELADQGEIQIDGTVVNDLPPRNRDVSIAFESYALYPNFTVLDNIAFSLRVSSIRTRIPREEIVRRVQEMADLLEIGHLLDRLPRQLSGGQRQRVALGRALVRKASAHLLDEPIAHLDAKLRHQLRGTLKRLQKERGITTIWTTPDQLEAMSIGDRIVVLNKGVIEQIGSPSELYERPKNQFVARSLGEPPMNFLDARIHQRDGAWFLDMEGAGGASLSLPPETAGPLMEKNGGDRVTVGIRPSDIEIRSEPPAAGAAPAEVILYEPLGQYGVATVRALERELKVKTNKGVDYQPGTQAWLVPNPNRYYFFHPQTGESLRP
ncbi:MAG: ABC transporter ATP-binding protein [Nitrospinota bacterium]